jgi:hypothetical protein
MSVRKFNLLLLLTMLWMRRVNHGVQTMYEFAEEAGSMERSRYFGFSKGAHGADAMA